MPRTEVTGSQIKDGSVSLTADVTGILPVGNGGTGSNTLPLNNVLLGNGTGALQAVAPGAAGNVLTSNGSTWVSAPASGEVTLTGSQTLSNKTLNSPIINGPTGSDPLVIRNNGNTSFTFNQYGEFVSLAGYGIFYDGNVSTTAFSATGALFLTSGKGGATSQDITLKPSGTGKISLASASVEANGVPVVTTTGTQNLSNKTFVSDTIFEGRIRQSLSTPVPATYGAYLSTAAYGVDQGDNCTHFGYRDPNGLFYNYIRGASTNISGALSVGGLAEFGGSVFINGVAAVTTSAVQSLSNKTLVSPVLVATNGYPSLSGANAGLGLSGLGYLASAAVAGNWSNQAAVGDVVLRADSNNLILTARNNSGSVKIATGDGDNVRMTISSNNQVVVNNPDSLRVSTVANTIQPSYYAYDANAAYPAPWLPVNNDWKDLLRFARLGLPTFEIFTSGAWVSGGTCPATLFDGRDGVHTQVANGTTQTAVRFTWNSYLGWSNPAWIALVMPYIGTPPVMNVLAQSSADGTTWTTRHTSTGTQMQAGKFWLRYDDHQGESWVRITLTVTNSQPITIGTLELLSNRPDYPQRVWGEFPYDWDEQRRITIGNEGAGSAGGARSQGVLNVGPAAASSAAQGIYFGNDTNLYRVGANTLKTDGALQVGGMLLASTSMSSQLDWLNSPISIRERGLVGNTQSSDAYAPNLNFHWGGRFSGSLWLNADGALSYGTYHSSGVPNATGMIRAGIFEGSLQGNATTATRLATARSITLTGPVTGSVSFDGSGNVDLLTGIGRANADNYANIRVLANFNTTALNDGMFIGYANGNNGVTRLFGGGDTDWPITVNSGRLYFPRSAASGLSTFSIAQSVIGNIHIQNPSGSNTTDQTQAAITFSGGSTNAQAGIYVLNNNADGTRMGFATTNNYSIGPQLFLTASNQGVVNFPRALPQHNGVNLVDLSSAQSLSNKTLTSPTISTPTINGGLATVTGGGTTDLRLTSTAGFGAARLSFYSDYGSGNEWRPGFIQSSDNGSFGGTLNFYTNGVGSDNKLGEVVGMSLYNGGLTVFGGLNVAGVPVVTTTGTQTLTNKTFTNPNVNGNLWLTGNATLLYPGVYLGPDANAGLNYAHEGGYHSAISTNKSLVLTNLVGDIVITNRTASKSIIFGTGGASDVERMRITSAGNVGIGTTSPAVKLDVFDGAAWFRRTANGLQTNLQLGRMDDGTTTPLYLVQTDDTNGDILRLHSQRWGAQFQFSRSGASGDRQIAEIQGNDGVGGTVSVFDASNTTTAQIRGAGDTYFNGGNVGIGTNFPAAKLDVVGEIRGTTVRTNSIRDTSGGSWLVTNPEGPIAYISPGERSAFQVTAQPNSVNFLRVSGNATGGGVNVSAGGSDANVSMHLYSQGTGTINANGVPVVTTTASQTLTNKTLASPTINGTASGTWNHSGVINFYNGTTDFTNDYINSPISIRERGLVSNTQTSDAYAPGMCFHWGGRNSGFLWMDGNGWLNYGGDRYSSTTPNSAGTIRAATFRGALVGNADTATTLQTARTINGVSFNGSANITLPTVNTSGDQTIDGNKTFTSRIRTVSQPSSWLNGVTGNSALTITNTGDAGNSYFGWVSQRTVGGAYTLGILNNSVYLNWFTNAQIDAGTNSPLSVMRFESNGDFFAAGVGNATRFVSSVGTGSAPLTVSSTTLCTNLNADLLDGMQTNTFSSANTVVNRDGSGHIYANYVHSAYLNMNHSAENRTGDTVFYSSNDDYLRKNTASGFKTSLALNNVDNTSDATKWSATATLTNKRITPRVGTTSSTATPSINTDATDQYTITALAAAITSVTVTGTPTDGQRLTVRIKDNGTARAVAWGSSFVASGVAPLLTTTVASKTHLCSFLYDTAAAKWVAVATDDVGY